MEMRDRLIELYRNAKAAGKAENLSCDIARNMFVVDFLLANGVIVPPCKVGDTAWFLLEDDCPIHKWYLSPEPVTEVGSRGFFVSGYANDENDMSTFTPWTRVGVDVFFSEETAKVAQKERERK